MNVQTKFCSHFELLKHSSSFLFITIHTTFCEYRHDRQMDVKRMLFDYCYTNITSPHFFYIDVLKVVVDLVDDRYLSDVYFFFRFAICSLNLGSMKTCPKNKYTPCL